MPHYHSQADLSPTYVEAVPVREILIATNGVLLGCMEARYDNLEDYVNHYAAPLSTLRLLWTFYDPIVPERTLLVQCEMRHLCKQCRSTMDDCACAF